MNELPENWIETTLGEIALWGSGGTPNRNKSEYYGGNIPWFKTGELNEGIVTEAEEYLTEEGLKNSSAKIFPKGSIMIAMYGATIGKCAILGVDGSTNQACAVAQPKKEIEPLYLFHYLRSQKQNFIDKGKGGAQPNISQSVIKEHPFPLPPLPEQKRIVAKLDNLFAHLDSISNRFEIIKKITEQFVTLCLTGSKRSTLHEYLEEGTKRIGENWQSRNRIGVSAKDGIIPLDTGTKTTFENYKIVKPGDFVYNAMRVNIGSIAIYNGVEDAITSPDYIVFRVKHTLSPRLLLHYLKSEGGLREIGTNTKGSVRSRLYFKSLVEINYPIANDRNQVVAEKFLQWKQNLDSLLSAKIETTIRNLRQAILSKAFRGELVDQVETDKPAEELLRRINEKRKIEDEVYSIKIPKNSIDTYFETIETTTLTVMEIFEVLENAKRKLTTHEVWQRSKYKNNIDEFYESLKEEVEVKKRIKESDDKKHLILAK